MIPFDIIKTSSKDTTQISWEDKMNELNTIIAEQKKLIERLYGIVELQDKQLEEFQSKIIRKTTT